MNDEDKYEFFVEAFYEEDAYEHTMDDRDVIDRMVEWL